MLYANIRRKHKEKQNNEAPLNVQVTSVFNRAILLVGGFLVTHKITTFL
nr:MAG TPA: hypothetical protein [Caudoviricetes sp.]